MGSPVWVVNTRGAVGGKHKGNGGGNVYACGHVWCSGYVWYRQVNKELEVNKE